MSDKTIINQEIASNKPANQTVLNTEIALPRVNVSSGDILKGKYKIISPLNVSTGEADLYLCKYGVESCVAKIYRRKRAFKPQVLDSLRELDSPYIAKIYDFGEIGGFPFEIIQYFRNGSLQGKRFTLFELRETVIPCINEALNLLHKNGIMHKDLKPSNIMLCNDGKRVALIDFGISSVSEDGNTVVVTQTGMTPEYSAPETFNGLFLAESDYYSLGITVFELFTGRTPYKDMSPEEIARFTALQRVPTNDLPDELAELITAVTYYDVTNRHDKSNPNRRWTYEEVKNWCLRKKQVIPGEGREPATGGVSYKFLGKEYADISSLVPALAENWEDGKRQLYRGHLSAFYKGINPEISDFCMDAEEKSNRNPGKDDVIFWELLYKLDPEMKKFCWKGRSFESLSAFGRDMLEKLWKKDLSDRKFWDSVLQNNLLSLYLGFMKGADAAMISAVSALETSHSLELKDDRDLTLHYYTLAYMLSGQKVLYVDGRQMKTVPELTDYMKSLLDSSYEAFEAFCHRMIDYENNLDVQLEAWLIAIGKRKEIDNWKNHLSK